jgi:tetratricopeptide (TPR) repeat protein
MLAMTFASGLLVAPSVYAQTESSGPQPKPSPSQSNVGASASQSNSSSSRLRQQQTPPSREQRAEAYARLLEGQRYLLSIGRNSSEAAVRQAQQAFQEAAMLDPTLAEAHTALAEMAFFYPPYDYDKAVSEAETAVRIDPNNFGAHRLLSRLYASNSGLQGNKLDQQFVTKAIKELREVARLEPTDAEAWALLGELYLATARTDEAITAFTRWAAAPATSETRFYQAITKGRELSPDAAAARLGEALLKAGRSAEAVVAIRRAISLDPENKDYLELLSKAIEAGGSNDSNALAELQRMAAADPSNTAKVRSLARAQVRAGRIDDAIATLRAAIERRTKADADQQALRYELAQVLSDALRYSDAIAAYEQLLKDNGITDAPVTTDDERELTTEILRRIVKLQKSAGRSAEAVATIARMRRVLGKDDPIADAENIGLLREQGKRREAWEAARAARQRFPELSAFLQLEAATLADLNRVDEAVALLRTRLKGTLEDFDLYLSISGLYTQAGRGREAVEAARKALELAPTDNGELVSAALIALSSAQERAGDPKGSEESLRRVLASEPNNATALNNLGYFLVERNERLNEALEMIQKAVRAEPTNSSFLDSLGWAYFKLGNLDEAERHLSEAARRDATSATIQEHLGDLYLKRGQLEMARAAWEKALSLSVEANEIARIKSKLSSKLKK